MRLGILIFDQDAAATARGNAFVATADNPSALYYNPAGITQLEGQQLRLGVYSLTYQNDYLSLADVASKSTRAYEALPQIYYTFSSSKYPVLSGLWHRQAFADAAGQAKTVSQMGASAFLAAHEMKRKRHP